MFFSCCDWEALRDADKTPKEEDTYLNENFSDSEDEILEKIQASNGSIDEASSELPTKEAKRKEKASRKFQDSQPSNIDLPTDNTDEFDVDLVMKRVLNPNDTERIVSTKKYFNKSKRHHSSRKGSSTVSQSKKFSGISEISKLSGSKEINKEISECLSPMGAQRRISFSEFTSPDKSSQRMYISQTPQQ